MFKNCRFQLHDINPKLLCLIFIVLMLFLVMPDIAHSEEDHRMSQDLHKNETTMMKMMSYMIQFGYLESPSVLNNIAFSDEEIADGISLVQQVGHLPQTGILDEATYRLINSPRCGVSDFSLVQQLKRTRQKRYAINKHVKPWDKFPITWRLEWQSPKLNLSKVISELDRAFRFWSDSTTVRFQMVDGNTVQRGEEEADIVVSFLRGEHGDGTRFHSPGTGTQLAHSFFPTGSKGLAGDIHLNEDENWEIHENVKNSESGVSIFANVVHEIGHSLGLSHSFDPKSIMFPIIDASRRFDRLPEDDRRGIAALYGSKIIDKTDTNEPREPTTNIPYLTSKKKLILPYLRGSRPIVHVGPINIAPSRPTLPPDLCSKAVDVITFIRDEMYIFKDEYMWRMAQNDQLKGPMISASYWLGLPREIKRIDAAYGHSGTKDTVLFSGKKFWVFNNRSLRPGYPQSLKALGLPSQVTKLDAAISNSDTEVTFFTKNVYYEYDEKSHWVRKGPRRSNKWEGVKYPVNSAFTWKDGATYFFQGELFWKFNHITNRVDDETGKLTRTHWFKCPARISNEVHTNINAAMTACRNAYRKNAPINRINFLLCLNYLGISIN